MGHCVFMLRPDSIYDDSPAEQYQFPKQYFSRAENASGDWIAYLEPKKVPGSRGYFAIARVQAIIPDPKSPDMFLAIIEPGTYLDFACPVPFSDGDGPIERGLLNDQGKLSGRAQAAVRPISEADFLRIIDYGLDQSGDMPTPLHAAPTPGLAEEPAPLYFETERQRLSQLTNRLVRDRVFRKVILTAYEKRCAITGLQFINGGGWAEVEAAHIRPVDQNGPDIVHNGIALSATAHRMFDRGLISLADDLEILVSRHVNDIDGLKAFINKSGRAIPPRREADCPHPRFLRWHRENCFKA